MQNGWNLRSALPLFFLAFSAWISADVTYRAEASSEPDPERVRAARAYREHCQSCHGKEGRSKFPALNLADQEWMHGESLEDISRSIREGIPGTSMMPFRHKLSEQEISSLAEYVASLPEKGR